MESKIGDLDSELRHLLHSAQSTCLVAIGCLVLFVVRPEMEVKCYGRFATTVVCCALVAHGSTGQSKLCFPVLYTVGVLTLQRARFLGQRISRLSLYLSPCLGYFGDLVFHLSSLCYHLPFTHFLTCIVAGFSASRWSLCS